MSRSRIEPRRYRAFGPEQIDDLPQLETLDREVLKAVAHVLPFRVNAYVLDELVDWSRVPDDPLFRLTFPQPEMLDRPDLDALLGLFRRDAPPQAIREAARAIQRRLNPHPGGQRELNMPVLDGERLHGMQHKYRETVLFFPSQGQTCHAYCTYCFRWAQFVGLKELRFASREVDALSRYLSHHREVTDVLYTGGDPLVMKARVLQSYVDPLLQPGLEHVRTIRIGSKAPAYWPYRFVTDPDADDLLRLFERVVAGGKHLALMAHYSHPRELSTPVAEEAVRRIRSTGAEVRCQAPLVRHVNDDADTQVALWSRQVGLGAVPYYLFVERNTGPQRYFEVPLARAHDVFDQACRRVSGLGRTVRGPVMSATPGKVLVDGIAELAGEKVFVLKLLQGRDPDWVNQIFFARFDPEATWLDQLAPAFGEREFFFEPPLRALSERLRPARPGREGGRRPLFARGRLMNGEGTCDDRSRHCRLWCGWGASSPTRSRPPKAKSR